MPGPGGGGHGGGGHGGGGFGGGGRGGGFGGGGFGGGHYGGPRGPHGYYHRPYRHYGWYGPGFGCLGGLGSLLIAPLVLLLIAIILITNLFSVGISSLWTGGAVVYDEMAFQEYANAQYDAVYGSTTAYEDGLLIVVLIDEEYETYDYIAWVGDHIRPQVNDLFGNEYTDFGRTMNGRIASPYRYSLDGNLAAVVSTMADRIAALSVTPPSFFSCQEDHNQVTPRLINRTSLPMTAATVDTALADFEARTGISACIVVAEREAVFGRTMPWFSLILSILLIALAIFLIVRAVRQKSGGGGGGGRSNNVYGNYGNGGTETRSYW